MFFAILVVLASCLSWVAFALRMRIREYRHLRRTDRIGEQVWFEVVQESAKKDGPYGPASFDGMRAISAFLNDSSRHGGRPRVTFAWMRSATDKERLSRLYVGVSEGAGEAGESALRAYAKSIGARIKPAPDIEFPDENVVVAYRDRVIPTQVTDTVSEIGVAADAIASVASAAGDADTSAVFITLDGMGKAERSMLNDAIMTEVVMGAGNHALFASSSARSMNQMTDGAVRMGLGAANIGGTPRNSASLLQAATSATSSLGYGVDISQPRGNHLAEAGFYAVPAALVAVLTMVFGQPLVGTIGLALMAAAAATVFMWDEAFDAPVRRMAARGEIMLPEFLPRPMSGRRGWQGLWLRFRMRGNRDDEQQQGGISLKATPYPSDDSVLTAHQSSLFELTTFAANATLTAGERIQSRSLPPNMVDVDEGIFVGLDGADQPVFLDFDDIHYSLYTAGVPNSGKSNLLLVMYAGMVKASIHHTAGLSLSPIWGETKGEGAYDAWKIARHNPGAVFVDVHNPKGNARLALEGRRLSEGETVPNVIGNCTRLVSSLQAAYGDGIKSQAREIFDNVLRCAMLMTPDEIRFAELDRLPGINPDKPNIMELSYYLLLGDSRIDPSAKMVNLGGVLSQSNGLRETELSRAIGSMSRFWEPTTRRTYAERMSTVLNKINDMRNARMLWSPDRRQDVYVGQLVQAFVPSVVNMGSFYNADIRQFDQTVDRSVSQRLIRSFNYLLWDYIKGRCNGWQAEGKRVPMFFDEVADVAANAVGEDVPNTLEEGTKEGRSRGAAYFLGSQYPSQMPEMVRHQVLASRGKFWFGLQNTADLTLAVDDLMVSDSDAEGAVTPGNIKSLPNGTCFATIPRSNAVAPPILLRVPYAPVWNKMLFAAENVDTGDAVADYVEHLGQQQGVPA